MIRIINNFQNLTGFNAGEYNHEYRRYSDLVANLPDRVALAKSLVTKNHQEVILKLKMLQRFEQQSALFETFMKGNKVLNKIIVKDPKLIRYVADRMTDEKFVCEICQKLSYVSKLILFNKLGRVMKDGDDVFTQIKKTQGIYMAFRLLPSCSEKLIMTISGNYKYRFTSRQLIALHKKYPNFLEKYFEAGFANLLGQNKLINYLVNNDVQTLRCLLKFGIPSLGRKGVQKLLREDKDFVLINAKEFQNHYDSISRMLTSNDFNIYFRNLFPKRIKDSSDLSDAIRNLEIVPYPLRYLEFNLAHHDMYGYNYKAFNKDFLEMLPWTDREIYDLSNNVELLDAHTALKLIEDELKFTYDIEGRCSLLVKMIETCRINKSQEKLLDVLYYFCAKHKNDCEEIKSKFLQKLMSSFDLNTFCEKTWDCIILIFNTFKARRELRYDENDCAKGLISRKMLMDDDFGFNNSEFTNDSIHYNYWSVLSRSEPRMNYNFLLKFARNVEHLQRRSVKGLSVYLIDLLRMFNKNNPKYRISYFRYPFVVKEVFDDFLKNQKEGRSRVDTILRFIPKDHFENQQRDIYLEMFMEESTCRVSIPLGMWMLKYRPYMFVKYIKKFLSGGEVYSPFYYEISKMHYADVQTIYRSECIERLSSMLDTNILWYLSYEPDYLELVSRYIPCNNFKIDFNEHDMIKTVEFRRIIFATFKNRFVEEPHIQILMDYLRGDYYRYAIWPIYRSYYHLPQDQLLDRFEVFNEMSDSAQKHCISLCAKLLDKTGVHKMLSQYSEVDYIRRALFLTSFYAFCNFPSEKMLDLLYVQIKQLKVHRIIMKLEYIPEHVTHYYINKMITYLTSAAKEDFHSLNIIEPIMISKFSTESCTTLLKLVVFSKDCHQFVYNYIMSKFDDAVEKLHEAIDNSTAENKLSPMISLFDDLCRNFIREKNKEMAKKRCGEFKPYLKQDLYSSIEIEMRVNTVCCYFESGFGGLAKFYIQHQGETVQKYGPSIIPYHSKIVNQCLHMILEQLDEDCEDLHFNSCYFIDKILNECTSTHNRLLAIELLPSINITNKKYIYFMINILRRLQIDKSEVLKKLLYLKQSRMSY